MLMMMHFANEVQQPIIVTTLVFNLAIKTSYPFRAIDIMLDTTPTY
jgi:hypothetical protein